MSNCIFTVWVPFSREIHGVSRGVKTLGSGFPIGARSIPVGTRLLHELACSQLRKSSVLYLLRRHAVACCRWKGLSHARQTLFGGSRTGGFCGLKGTQNEGFSMSKIRLFVCSWHRKSWSCAERFSVPTGEQEVYITRRSDQLPYRIFSNSNSKGIVNFFGSSFMESFKI